MELIKKNILLLAALLVPISSQAMVGFNDYKDYFYIESSPATAAYIFALSTDSNHEALLVNNQNFIIHDSEYHNCGDTKVTLVPKGESPNDNQCIITIKDCPYAHPTFNAQCIGNIKYAGVTYTGNNHYTLILQ